MTIFIVSKRLGLRYRSGRFPDWLKFKNPSLGAESAVAAVRVVGGQHRPAAGV
jgi:hypothetical protein